MKKRFTCPNCNHFFGYLSEIKEGKAELYCSKCKKWIVLIVIKKDANTIKSD